jgi:hypothetical protein
MAVVRKYADGVAALTERVDKLDVALTVDRQQAYERDKKMLTLIDTIAKAGMRPAPTGDAAQDHGGTEAASLHAESIRAPDGPASVQPSPAPSPAAPEAWPSEAAIWAARKAMNEYALSPGDGLCLEPYTEAEVGLEAGYAIDRPAIEAAARERAVREFARWLTGRKDGIPYARDADRFLATHGRPA